MAVIESPRGVPVELRRIFPNRFNPNEMLSSWTRERLQVDVRVDDYDPIVISPARIFYQGKLRTLIVESEAGAEVKFKALLEQLGFTVNDVYVICDGEQRYNQAVEIGMTHIRALIQPWVEDDAMPHFYKRQTIRGEMDPFKEAMLFMHERRVNGLTLEQIKKKYTLSSVFYIRGRLKMYDVHPAVIELFWEPPEDAPGLLLFAHLQELSTLPRKYQKAVATMALYRKWTSEDVRVEVRRIKDAKGISDVRAYIKAAQKSPPDRTKRKYKKREKEEEEPEPDEKVFEDYPDDALEEELPEVGPTVVRDERLTRPVPVKDRLPARVRPAPITQPVEVAPQVPEEVKPLYVNGALLEAFFELVLTRGVEEGLDLRSASKGVMRHELVVKTYNLLRQYETSGYPRDALMAALKCAQMFILETEGS